MDPRNGGDLLCSQEGVYPVPRRGRWEGGAGYGCCPIEVGGGDPQDPFRVPAVPVCAPVVSPLFLFSAPGALGLGAVRCLFFGPPASWLSVRSRLVCVSRLAVGCSLVVAPPLPHLLCLRVFIAAARCSVFFFSLRCAPLLYPAFSRFRPRVPLASALCVVCFVGLPLLGSPCALASFVLSAWRLAAPWWLLPHPPPLCGVSGGRARCALVPDGNKKISKTGRKNFLNSGQ